MPLPLFQPRKPAHPLAQIKTIIAIAAGKGGVGKSSVTVNLAAALKAKGYQVGVMDTDIYGPSIRKMLPEDELPWQKGQTIMPAICAGVKMISMAYFRKEQEAAVIRAPIVNGIISQFIQQVEWGSLDFLLIDFPPGTGDIQLTLSQQANITGAIMVTTPQEVALLDVRKAMHHFDQVKVPLLGVVENMSYYVYPKTQEKIYIFGQGGGERLAREAGIPLLGQIPLDPELCENGDRGLSLFMTDPTHKKDVTKAYLHIAESLIEQLASNSNRHLRLKDLKQNDRSSCTITWSDGQTQDFRYSDLQRNCPCANCVDEATGQRRNNTTLVPDDLGVLTIESVGQYALKIKFTSGCSTGIYPFDLLRKHGVYR